MPPSEDETVERFVAFYREAYRDEVEAFERRYPDERHSLHVDWADLDRYDPELAERLVSEPEATLECAREALQLHHPATGGGLGDAGVLVFGVDGTPSPTGFRSEHLGTLVAVAGQVRGVSPVTSALSEGAWECERCGTLTRVSCPARPGGETAPDECPDCEREGPFDLDHDRSEWTDHHSFAVETRRSGAESETVVVEVLGDATGTVSAGRHARVTGVLRREALGEHHGSSAPDKYVEAHAVASGSRVGLDLSEDDKERILELSDAPDVHERLVDSLAPGVHGHRETKLALVLGLFSGVSKDLPDGSRIRGSIHTLLVGDPGTAKSALGNAARRLAPDGRRLWGGRGDPSGTGEDEAPSPAEGGFLFVDDVDELSTEVRRELTDVVLTDRDATASGSGTAFPPRTSVFCTAGPGYGRFDEYEPLVGQLGLEPAFVSGFDLVLTAPDRPDEEGDRELAEHVVRTNVAGELRANRSNCRVTHVSPRAMDDAVEGVSPPVAPDLFRRYVAFARLNCYPTMTEAATETIREFYVSLRKRGEGADAPVPVTARRIEALVRLAEASARVRLADRVTTEDVDRAVGLVRSSLLDVGIDPETGAFDADVVEVGASKTERDHRRNVKAIVGELQDEHERGAPVEAVLERAERIGLDQETAERVLRTLEERGEISEPSADHLRVS